MTATRIQIGGAGGAPSNNFIRSLREAGNPYYLIGSNVSPTELFLSDTDERHLVRSASAPDYREKLRGLLERGKAQ